VAYPAGDAFAPRGAFGNHGGGAGDHGTRDFMDRWQRFARSHIHDLELLQAESGAKPEPVREIAMASADGIRRPTGADDQYRFHAIAS
jgi:hypothetical protein